MVEVGKRLDPLKKHWDPVRRRIRQVSSRSSDVCLTNGVIVLVRCMEHALNLGAGHLIKGVAPTPAHTLSHREGRDDDGEGDDDGANVAYETSDSLGKALALVTQVIDL
jgi:hypothetical protein